jgi:hypothetical protein
VTDVKPHYAQVFAPRPGHCFRYVSRPEAEGQPMPCPDPPVWRGHFRARNGRQYDVEACDGHRGGLTDAYRIGTRRG